MQNQQEQIIQTKQCKSCSATFHITDKDMEFYDKVSPTFGGKKYQIPSPTLCPDCRQQRRLTRRNERKLYRRKCDATGKPIISIYSQEKSYKVYSQDFRRSDNRDPMQYGRDFNFNRGFFEQFDELMKEVPQFNLANFNNENADYVNYLNDSKSCYLTFGSGFLENSYFCNWSYEGNNIVDSSYCFRDQITYQSINCENSHKLLFCQNVKNSSDCFFCANCDNCNHCIGCINMVNASYVIFNKQYSKEEYEIKKSTLNLFDGDFQRQFEEHKKKFPKIYIQANNSENSSGDYIKQSRNITNSFEIDKSENCKYCRELIDDKDCVDVNNYGYSSLCYEIMGFGYSSKNAFTLYSVNGDNLLYSAYCQNGCSYCFGCIGLKAKKYCILNKQYTKEEYEQLVPQIIQKMKADGEWGEFFPISMSPFAYNETVAQEYFPLTKEKTKEKGFKRKDDEDKNFDGPAYIPKDIEIYKTNEKEKELLLNSIIKCEVSGRPFRIIQQELDFYLKHNLPIPTKHPDVRHEERMKLRNPRKLFERICDCPDCTENHKAKGTYQSANFSLNTKTGKEGLKMQTTYSPEREEIVYCEGCYTREVYG